MPMKNGILTPQERAFAEAMALSGSQKLAMKAAGIKHQPHASVMAARPGVQQAIVDLQIAALHNELLPLAVAAHRRLLTDPKTPAGAVATAVKLAYDRTLGLQEHTGEKEPHEMTPEELANAIRNLERIKADMARPVLELEAEPTVFD